MASVYTVNCTSSQPLNVRSGPGTSYKAIGTKRKGDTVTAYDEKNGWCKISQNSDQWVSKSYLKASETTTNNTGASASGSGVESNEYFPDYTGEVYRYGMTNSMSSTELQEEIRSTLKAFGAPPRFLDSADPHYLSAIPAGRVYTDTIMMSPTILSIMPCSVQYLPKFNKKEQDNFLSRVVGLAKDDSDLVAKLQADVNDTGSLFTTKSAYDEYIKTVNLLCRISAIYLGISDWTVPGTSIKYKDYDWGFYTCGETPTSGGIKSIFNTLTNVGESITGNRAYIHFFCNQPGIDTSETISTSTRDSAIANLFNGSISDLAKDLNFLVGGGLSTEANLEIDNVISSLGDNTFSNLLKFGKEYFNGSRLAFPQMLDNVTYGKSMSVSIRLASSSGSVENIYLQEIVPACHILAFGLPKQVSENMYTYPFLCRVACRGRFSSELAVITDVSLERGGDGGRWTNDKLPTECDLRFSITPLYSNLMVTSSDHPLLFLSNTALVEYLAIMCGVDLKKANNELKYEAAVNSIRRRFKDAPVNVARSVMDSGMVNFARNLLQMP